MHNDRIDEILSFWFDLPDRQAWFQANDTFDEQVRTNFQLLLLPAVAGRYDDWAKRPDGALALVVLLDQFSRNIHRGTSGAFACDAKAREIARRAIDAGFDREMPVDRRLFVYLPFEHSEWLADQDLSCRLIRSLGDAEQTGYADRHRGIIARFWRFPHRNAILGRVSTQAELDFLKEPNSSF